MKFGTYHQVARTTGPTGYIGTYVSGGAIPTITTPYVPVPLLPTVTTGTAVTPPNMDLNTPNLYPGSTSDGVSTLTPVSNPTGGIVRMSGLRYVYDFTQMVAFEFDLIFSGIQNTDTSNSCLVSSYPSEYLQLGWPVVYQYVVGNQFWAFGGDSAGGDYDLPRIQVLLAFKGGHAPL